jgi:hypothetical protein
VHELRVSIETLTERLDALLKATGENTEDRSEPERADDDSEKPFEPEIPESEAA